MVKASNLRGRGGAGFPTGLKWTFIPKAAPHPRYLVANADEMEPGTFKDRLLLEGDPHQLIEGMALAGYATGTDVAYIFLRGEYKLAARRIEKAIAEAYRAGISGEEYSRLRLQPRVVPTRQRRPLHVRRRDRDAERPRRQTRQPAAKPHQCRHASERLAIQPGETTADERFTLIPIVCLGACDHAPVMMIDDDMHLDLTPEKIDQILERYK